jgi:WD40 repeat protein
MHMAKSASVLLAGLATIAIAQALQSRPDVIQIPAEITSGAFSATSNKTAVVSKDKKLTLWDLADGRLLRTISLSTAYVFVTAISDDARWIFTGDNTGNMCVWDSSTGQAQIQLKMSHYPGAAAFSIDGKFIAIAPMGDPVQVFEISSAKMISQTAPVTGGSEAVAFSRDGTKFATADADTVVRVYDAHTGKLISENHDFFMEPLALDFTSDGKQVIAGGGDKVIAFIDAATGKLLRRLEKTDQPPAFIKVSPDGSLVAAVLMKAENMTQPAPIVVWQVSSGQKKSQWMPAVLAGGLDWTCDGRLISVGPDSSALHIWQVPLQ